MSTRTVADKLRKQYVADDVQKDENGGDRVRRFVISTESPDRDNDTIAVNGWKTENYLKNPVVLWAHDYSQLPLGKALSVGVSNGKLVATAQFADHPMADTVLRLIDGGFLRATSVGFKPTKYLFNETRGGFDFAEQELLEFSVVPVPANAEALITMAAGEDREMLLKWATDVTKALTKAEEPVKAEEPAKVEEPVKVPVFDPIAFKADMAAMIAEALAGLTKQTEKQIAEAVVDGLDKADAAIEKTGRKLSKANESRIRAAKEQLDEVLVQLEKEPDGADEHETEEEKKPKPMACSHGAGCTECKGDQFAIEFEDEKDGEIVIDLTPEQVTQALASAYGDIIGPLVRDAVETAVNRSRGRVD